MWAMPGAPVIASCRRSCSWINIRLIRLPGEVAVDPLAEETRMGSRVAAEFRWHAPRVRWQEGVVLSNARQSDC